MQHGIHESAAGLIRLMLVPDPLAQATGRRPYRSAPAGLTDRKTGASPMPSPRPFSNAEKQRRYRRRKRAGIRIVSLELGKADIEALIDRGGLSEADLNDSASVGRAFRAITSHTPGSLSIVGGGGNYRKESA